MRILFRPEARAEVLEAQSWYESRNPDAFAQIAGSCRRVLLRKFPFSLDFRVRADEFLVIAVFHHRRNPAQLTERTQR